MFVLKANLEKRIQIIYAIVWIDMFKSDQPIIPIEVLQLVLQYLNYYHRTLSAVQDHAMYQLIYQLIDI